MTIDEKLLDVQNKFERKIGGIGKGKYSRILKMAKKPTRDEYLKVILITGAGIMILGLVGFFIYLVMGVYIHLP
ncbi:MAG: protein translocase SEC61 complex subunit gamma [Candidatus Thermoplasmatota archaeon]|nr:protein translocase SEC61 complex subunit gamma [Candidatus Thermoplasmatota archaeon]